MPLTELEGAVLSEIHDRGNRTAFKVRRAFQLSPSTEWSGSAGAVYPAIRRLEARGLVESVALSTSRAGKSLSLTEAGVAALHSWAVDAGRALGVGLDPFRLRSGVWAGMTDDVRADVLKRLLDAVEAEVGSAGERGATLDRAERARFTLALRLQRTRRDWLLAEIEGAKPGPAAAESPD